MACTELREAAKPRNSILFDLETKGCGTVTAAAEGIVFLGSPGEGVRASERIAQSDTCRLAAFKDLFIEAGAQYYLPPALLAAICSRETHAKNVVGDRGNGIGLMQIDKRYHALFATNKKLAMSPRDNIVYAAGLLDRYRRYLEGVLKWTPAQTLLGAVVAYNSGPKNVQSLDKMDVGTTGGDYGSDVWARARYLAKYFI